jgi:hypothetical protein
MPVLSDPKQRSIDTNFVLSEICLRVDHDLTMRTAVSISIFDAEGRLHWAESLKERLTLLGAAADPHLS